MELKKVSMVKKAIKVGTWITSKEIRRKHGILPIETRAIVNRLRQQGIPIVAGNSGYSLATNKEQIAQQIKSLEGRRIKMLKAINGLKSKLK